MKNLDKKQNSLVISDLPEYMVPLTEKELSAICGGASTLSGSGVNAGGVPGNSNSGVKSGFKPALTRVKE